MKNYSKLTFMSDNLGFQSLQSHEYMKITQIKAIKLLIFVLVSAFAWFLTHSNRNSFSLENLFFYFFI